MGQIIGGILTIIILHHLVGWLWGRVHKSVYFPPIIKAISINYITYLIAIIAYGYGSSKEVMNSYGYYHTVWEIEEGAIIYALPVIAFLIYDIRKTLKTDTIKPETASTAVTRLGNVLYWAACLIALICLTAEAINGSGVPIVFALIIWGIARVVRYVLVGK